MRNIKHHSVIPMEATTKRILSPLDFINLPQEERQRIKCTRIIPPVLGKRRLTFGRIEVTYDSPVYVATHK